MKRAAAVLKKGESANQLTSAHRHNTQIIINLPLFGVYLTEAL